MGGLWIGSPEPGPPPLPKPRRLALLAVVAASGPSGVTRDRLLGLLWPERDESKARHALSQTLYSLRADLGTDVLLAEQTLRLNPERITADLDEFRAAIEGGQWLQAAGLYRGPFLEGFHLDNAVAFEDWVGLQRQLLHAEATRALEEAVAQAIAAGRARQAVSLTARLTELDPLSSRFAVRHMELLAGLGDRAGALAHERRHAEAVRAALDSDPDPVVTAYAARLRSRVHDHAGPSNLDPATPTPVVETPALPKGRTLSWTTLLVAAAALAFIGWIGSRGLVAGRPEREGLRVAVARIRDLGSPDSVQVSEILADMLTTSLGRVTGLEVIANSRILELMQVGADAGEGRAQAARRAGATELLEGEVVRRVDGELQLDLRRVDAASGTIRRGYRVSAANRFELIDSATAAIAADLRAPYHQVPVAELTTRSPLAYRFYEEGLRAFHQVDHFAARRLFQSALREDSTFALAAYYVWRSALASGDTGQATLGARALRLSARAPTRDRLLIRAHLAAVQDDPSGFAVAESLAVAFPNDPDALARAAEVFRQAGEPLGRVTGLLTRASQLDSAASVESEGCRTCAHLAVLAEVYRTADSFPAAEAVLRRWARLRPEDPAPWWELGGLLESASRYREADTAYAAARSRGGVDPDSTARHILRSAAAADPGPVEAACRAAEAAFRTSPLRRPCRRAYRTLGRLRQALLLTGSPSADGWPAQVEDQVEMGMLDFESGRIRLAAETFRRLAAASRPDPPVGPAAAGRFLALAAAADRAAGDSLRLRPLADTLVALEEKTLSGRRSRLARFVRALLLEQAGRPDEALVLMKDVIGGWGGDFPRFNYELGRIAVLAGRPGDAIGPARAALRAAGSQWGAGVSRGDLHELLATAFKALGQVDSARVHHSWLERAWEGADPVLKRRWAAARASLGRDTRPSGR